jgi:hypothetical protein
MKRLVLATSVALAGCAPMSEMQCRTANWYQQGEEDGLRGNQVSFAQYAHQCAAFQVQPSERDYMEGWRWGIGEWARRVNGSRI